MPWIASDPIRIVVPGEPKALGRQRHRIVPKKGGGAFVRNYMPAKSDAALANAQSYAFEAMGAAPPLNGPVDLRAIAFMPIPASWSQKKQRAALAGEIRPTGKPDADNILKLLKDALSKIVVRDDAMITDVVIWKRYSDRPRLVIDVRALTFQP